MDDYSDMKEAEVAEMQRTIDALVAALEDAKRMLDGAVLDDRSGLRKIDAALALARGGR